MNMKHILNLRILLALMASLTIVGCSRNSSDGNSRATGWKINDKNGGFQYNDKFQEQEAGPGLVFIEGGTFTMGRVADDPMHDWNNAPSQQHVQSFYMDETEVTNKMYLEFLDWVKRTYPPEEENYRLIYHGVLPDTLVWRNRLGYAETMTENYLRHPGYGEYPVVGVSWIQAVEFANWRTDRVAEMTLQEAGYLERDSHLTSTGESNFNVDTYINAPTETYGGNDSIINPDRSRRRVQTTAAGDTINVYANRESGLISPDYRLPTEAEWEYAALGMSELRSFNVYRGRKKYPWDGQYTRSGARKTKGDQLANFKQGKGDYGGIAGWSDDGADITAQVMSYEPNPYGLYDMAGNVAEWVADVYRPIVDDEFNDFNYYRGNVYTKNAITEDGTVKIVTPEEIVYDTLSNGKVVARNLPGEILQVGVDENDTYLRTQFDQSDNRNFRDGDARSSRQYADSFEESEEDVITHKMYNSPLHNVERDSLGKIVKEYDESNQRTSLINDEVRVYKGGSWRDRAYWLDPAQRRYFPQDMATDYIGFRCAMSRVGSKTQGSGKKRN
ncbi:gliding motility lipoprotein GldJ [Subsaximicrobium wynnwilliamsii]|uniref:Gliding motility lipoprotein GldJ n=1 Tax=Subsaximicrobium wynnwilliamsii TaxID=291179 RepID=A0A5C6ZH27_9FLAO|nr:gliding motility lipoprotein GldJ [Subsaximicrobium wynnwilliamsii]TXD82854.1 gliding motility lipoprotein GldJ [Subsaximicrobium wynnwilliamsii]TXD88576.1 gliding motility lipoprotein GldJ [Subsaximicrobium wynnwilliamsii]TXE02427.1 gliding motility lipoprotein GldJ [Subsaximicrobium wynnwilliamsii]